jgi:hypothetical protein
MHAPATRSLRGKFVLAFRFSHWENENPLAGFIASSSLRNIFSTNGSFAIFSAMSSRNQTSSSSVGEPFSPGRWLVSAKSPISLRNLIFLVATSGSGLLDLEFEVEQTVLLESGVHGLILGSQSTDHW